MINAFIRYFNSIAANYDSQFSQQQIVQEIDQIEHCLDLKKGMSILDIGCGTGKHAIELAKRGYIVTGIDFSSKMLEIASSNASKNCLKLNFIETSAESFTNEAFSERFDAAICLHESGLCLLNENESEWKKDMSILGNMSDLLKPNGKYFVTALNALKMFRETTEAEVENGIADLWKATKKHNLVINENGNKETVSVFKRYYTPAELTRMVNRVHLNIINSIVSLDEKEIILYGSKKTINENK